MLEKMVPNTDETSKSPNLLSENLVASTPTVGGKKDPSNLSDASDSNPKDQRILNKVPRYNSLTNDHLSTEKMKFIGKEFVVI